MNDGMKDIGVTKNVLYTRVTCLYHGIHSRLNHFDALIMII